MKQISLTPEQRKNVRGDWERPALQGELKIVPRHSYDKNFPKYEKMYHVIFQDEYTRNPRKYSQVI